MSIIPLLPSNRGISRGIRELHAVTGESTSMIAVMIEGRCTSVQSDVLADGIKRHLEQ
jgi:hypothetical protein